MKNILSAALTVLVLSGCIMRPLESDFAACPPTDLEAIAFYNGAPEHGNPIMPQIDSDGVQKWDFSTVSARVHATCRYNDGFLRTQLLPSRMTGCTLDPNVPYSAMRCEAVY